MRVLAIDDQPEALKQIRKAIESEEGPDGEPYEVVALEDHAQALKRLDEEHFDVVVTDMVMGTEEEEGLAILRKLTDKSPVTIVLTAYPSVRNCVEAMRAGAWDYLEKTPQDGGDAYENLLRSLEAACRQRLEDSEAGGSRADARWVHEHLGELTEQYAGQVVAVLDGKVVDHGDGYEGVVSRVKEEYPLARPTVVSIPETDVEAIE
ncbi:MAG: response regulator [Candidatus Brocadiia bacterium]